MSIANNLPVVIQETILTRLATLFLVGAGGDLAAAREAAAQLLAEYCPKTANELRLAAQIVSFSLHALEALSQASAPDISLSRTLRLRGSAVSLNRESEKAQRRLDQIQQARAETVAVQASKIEPVLELKQHSEIPHDQSQQDLRIAASLKRAEARTADHSHTSQCTPASLITPPQPELRANTL